ncbi:hypothetical protein JR316_0001127 [Psilocybe cubensis]|uniref:Uncharacterized protein n=3 Tax=Psilocybe cubensis TaxID=181762 RepID=A0ACB8HHV3_PSICU|nr:hypothetical protein JR316_0006114 [Psilocybe cubensis]XP_047749825.1 hypothetical protein JR316_0004295 [Psilocybe cubensis]XP_047754686.1 hypothetical protein JR316_0001127 [Psilocybe cubensis]KAH9481587.1 hypothetical protein JR316_0006114 [Psilocybe cubensis]KAH9482200.1 hypothetical protein JR316_0004295 [Psilocybe cubensis]KAH9487061.1 hypothetical protein JR316_0001127 [Psilocybe cubensis]
MLSSMVVPSNSIYAGLNSIISGSPSPTIENEPFIPEDVENDLDGETETLPNLSLHDLSSEDLDSHNPTASKWRDTITGASKGVTDKTDADYQRLIKQCIKFLISKNMIKKREDFACCNPPDDAPFFIAAWIMDKCDDIYLDGTLKPTHVVRDSYVHGQKMRASMTYLFGRELGLGSDRWRRNELTGKMIGNPSVSDTVATYMMSLRARKIRNGETPTSARAITSATLKALYDENHKSENYDIKPYAPGSRKEQDSNHWGGGLARRALEAIYTIAFLCLLRSDEVLKIRREHIVYQMNPPGLVLTLPFRKTHQHGGIKPFYLRLLAENEAHLCPVRAMANWLDASEITDGYIFRKIASGDRPSADNIPMTSEQFLELFRNNLLDIGVDPIPYGTHSFRRGGCQYLSSERRWSIRTICEWGGWSTEFSNLTISSALCVDEHVTVHSKIIYN